MLRPSPTRDSGIVAAALGFARSPLSAGETNGAPSNR